MPFWKSNVPYKMFYNTITSEILRIAKVSNNYTNFKTAVNKLVLRMKKQGAVEQPKEICS